MSSIVSSMFDSKIKEHPDEVVRYNVRLTPRQLYKLTLMLECISFKDEDGMSEILGTKHPPNTDYAKIKVNTDSSGNIVSIYFDTITNEEVERMWDEEEYKN